MERYYEPEEVYAKIRETSVEDMRREYSAMRDIAQKRLALLKSEGYDATQLYRDWVNRFPMLKEIGKTDTRYLAESVVDVTRFLAMKTSTVTGQREQFAKSLDKWSTHYSRDFGGTSPVEHQLFREMMRSIKDHAHADAYYRNWKSSFRKVLSKARSGKIDLEKLMEKLKRQDVTVGPKGGIYDARTKKSIEKTWSEMGNP